jgi:hypothetical protein
MTFEEFLKLGDPDVAWNVLEHLSQNDLDNLGRASAVAYELITYYVIHSLSKFTYRYNQLGNS